MHEKIIFIDYDGTLGDPFGNAPDSAIQAIHQAQKKGHKVFLCTGRSMAELYDEILAIGFDGIIAAGGGYIEVGGVCLYHRTFTKDEVVSICTYMNDHHIEFILEGNHDLYGSKHSKQQLEKNMTEHERAYVDSLVYDYTDSVYEKINKIVFFGVNLSLQIIADHFKNRFRIIPSTVPLYGDSSGEVTLPEIHKATAIEFVLDFLHIDRKDSFAYGDSHNDIEMLQYVHVGIAMKNSSQELFTICDDIAETASDHGIALSFQKYNLI